MKFSLALLATLALATISQAAPVEKQVAGKPFQLVKNPHYQANATRAILRAERKYARHSTKIPEQGKTVVKAAGSGSVPMTDVDYDVEYYATVSVGTPAQSIKLDFDTGSSDLWFSSTLCSSCGSKSFDPTKSSTYKKVGKSWQISYGDGSSASGITATDNVELGGLTITGQTIELATRESSSFSTGAIDGILGLGFDTIATVAGTKTPVDNLISQNLISKPIFGVWLGKQSEGGGGEYVFGGYNTDHIDGSLTTVKVDNSQGWYGVTVSGLKVGSKSVASSFDGILDTGTTLLIFDRSTASQVARAYGASDNGDGTYTISCDQSKLQPLALTMGGKDFFVPADSLIYVKQGSQCIAGFGYSSMDFAIIGDTFLKNNYVVFNQEVPEVQIAPSKA
uniref:Syncephapepsin n=1 Tax=Syncephalastrum racemosum TaxID=13706 RepID=B8YJG0_SYNRA|nr:syncephapepsin precursor [Syncephalastrum racemosum]